MSLKAVRRLRIGLALGRVLVLGLVGCTTAGTIDSAYVVSTSRGEALLTINSGHTNYFPEESPCLCSMFTLQSESVIFLHLYQVETGTEMLDGVRFGSTSIRCHPPKDGKLLCYGRMTEGGTNEGVIVVDATTLKRLFDRSAIEKKNPMLANLLEDEAIHTDPVTGNWVFPSRDGYTWAVDTNTLVASPFRGKVADLPLVYDRSKGDFSTMFGSPPEPWYQTHPDKIGDLHWCPDGDKRAWLAAGDCSKPISDHSFLHPFFFDLGPDVVLDPPGAFFIEESLVLKWDDPTHVLYRVGNDGQILWKVPLFDTVLIRAKDNRLLVIDSDKMKLLDLTTGAVLWQRAP